MYIGKYLELYSEDLRFKNYASNTIQNYCSQVYLFLRYFNEQVTKPSEINETQIKQWLMLAKTTNSMKHRLSALKLFYKYTIKQPMKFRHIEYPRSEQKLPQPLSELEVKMLFEVCDNLKHNTIPIYMKNDLFEVCEITNDDKQTLITIPTYEMAQAVLYKTLQEKLSSEHELLEQTETWFTVIKNGVETTVIIY